jgi:hypothetical protein
LGKKLPPNPPGQKGAEAETQNPEKKNWAKENLSRIRIRPKSQFTFENVTPKKARRFGKT